MTPDPLAALVARLEKAEGPDRWLDGEIWRLVNGWAEEDGHRFDDEDDGPVWHRRDPHDAIAFEVPPLLTASLDAALTLFPADTINKGQRLWWVDIEGLLGDWPIVEAGVNTEEATRISEQAKTAPLALCIAALHARGVAP